MKSRVQTYSQDGTLLREEEVEIEELEPTLEDRIAALESKATEHQARIESIEAKSVTSLEK